MAYQFKTTNIKGKEYVEVNQRILYFRNEEKYNGWSLISEIISLDSETCVIKASVLDDKGIVRATGFAQEDKSSSYINKTSFVENCETSAWGRALANIGIGIETSIASSNEVSMAVEKQKLGEAKVSLTADLVASMKKAVADGKEAQVRAALEKKYKATKAQEKEIFG